MHAGFECVVICCEGVGSGERSGEEGGRVGL